MTHAQEHNSHTKLIWKVFAILSVITIAEVALGITKPDALYLTKILGTPIVATPSLLRINRVFLNQVKKFPRETLNSISPRTACQRLLPCCTRLTPFLDLTYP